MRSTCIILGDTDMDQDWAALGARNRDENSVIHCTIYLVGPGQSQTDVNKAAFALLALIESYLRTNLTLGSNVNWAGVVPTTLLKQLGDNARIAVLDFNLKFFARI